MGWASAASQALTRANIGARLHPLEAFESSAGLTEADVDRAYPAPDLRRYLAALDGVTDDAAAWANAIAANAVILHPGGVSLVGSAVTLKSNLTIIGTHNRDSVVQASANTFSIFTDAGTARSNVKFFDLGFDGNSAGASNRCVHFDADTASQSSGIEFHRCRFANAYRGAELDRVNGLRFYDCEGESLDSSTLYVGETNATGRSADVRVRGVKVSGGDLVDAGGNGCILVGYCDGFSVDDVELIGTGASAGASNLFHGVYARACTDGRITGVRASAHRRGAAIHVFADTGAGEARNSNIVIADVIAQGQTHYAAVRCDEVDGLTLRAVTSDAGQTNAAYLTNVTGLVVDGVNGKNNNRERASGTQNALLRLQDIVGAAVRAVVGIDDDTGNGQYGQGALIYLAGANSDVHIADCHMTFPGGGAIGYYLVDLAAGTLDRFSVRDCTQDGASSLFNESGTATGGSFRDITETNVGTPDLLTLDQLHKFRCAGIEINGAAWRYESNGQNVTAHLSNFPASGNWLRDDTVWRTAAAASATPGWRCTADHAGGDGGTWKAMASLAA